jgi:hypothetical protein
MNAVTIAPDSSRVSGFLAHLILTGNIQESVDQLYSNLEAGIREETTAYVMREMLVRLPVPVAARITTYQQYVGDARCDILQQQIASRGVVSGALKRMAARTFFFLVVAGALVAAHHFRGHSHFLVSKLLNHATL